MMNICRLLAALSLLAVASAFLAPPPSSRSSLINHHRHGIPTSMSIRVEDAGAIPPHGYFDPLGFTSDGDPEKFARYRAAEIKHGRIAQLACLHYLVTYFFRLPGSLGGTPIDTIPNGFAALRAVPAAGWAQILLFASSLELLTVKNERRGPGIVHPKSSTFMSIHDQDDEVAMDYTNKELSNGRLAMVAILGILVQLSISGGEHPIDTLIRKLGGGMMA